MPVLADMKLTRAAIADVLNQTIPVKLLVINQGCSDEMRTEFEQLAEQNDRIYIWSYDPPLPSLSAAWNRALQFVWDTGETYAFLINNDIRMHREMLSGLRYCASTLDGWFVSGVGVHQQVDTIDVSAAVTGSRGGPDFSCYLITKEGHQTYPFDEGFIPAYCEDLDTHRRYMLGGHGDKIFSVNLPYWHVGGGSGTLKALDPDKRAALEAKIGASRAYYERKWGGPVNQERFTVPFDERTAQEGVTTPELQKGQLTDVHAD